MNEYLEKHQIYAMLQNAMEEVLVAQPERPLEYLQGYFQKQEDRAELITCPQVVLFGPPGCGKGAFGAKIAQHFGICQVSVGKLIQEAAASDGEVRALLERGEQISDNVLNPLEFGAVSK